MNRARPDMEYPAFTARPTGLQDAEGVEKQEPPVFRSGALRDVPLSIYLLGGFPPRGAPLFAVTI